MMEITFVHIRNYGDYPYHDSDMNAFIDFTLIGFMK